MNYQGQIHTLQSDPQGIEKLYASACEKKEAEDFKQAIRFLHEENPENLLFAAWYHRLEAGETEEQGTPVNWPLAIPLGVVTGLIFWALSDFNTSYLNVIPHLMLVWAPIATIFIMAFFALTGKREPKRSLWAGIGLVVVGAYVYLLSPGQSQDYQRHYIELMAIHLPLMAWIATGYSLLGLGSESKERFAFLRKSLEVFITAGVFSIAGGGFAAITMGMFQALNVSLPELIQRLIFAGGGGLIPLLAVASVYDPHLAPLAQEFQQGVGKVAGTLMRFLLPLSILVLLAYIIVIPFNFMEPFKNRDVLIVYNVMLFAIMGLLVGATPVHKGGLTPKIQNYLRLGSVTVSILAVIVSLYALSAVVWRTMHWGITINRLTVIGWNAINVGILLALIIEQFRQGREKWLETTHRILSLGTNAYLVWGMFLVLAVPWLFR